MNIQITNLRGAAWNTHHAAKKDDPEFKGLVTSVKKQGIIQRVLVRKRSDGSYEIIDGHRRVAAAKAAGIKDVPCDVVVADDVTAQAMTATANIQRLENDPLLEAELIGKMVAAKKTYKQIAALLGKSETYVARRARLTTLTEGWRRAVRLSDEMPDVSDLEIIAAHEPELQDKVLEAVSDDDGYVDWDDNFFYLFRNYMCELDAEKVDFDLSECATCKYNTAMHGEMLFPELAKVTECARCQNRECFARKSNEVVDGKIAALREKGVKIREVSKRWDIPRSYQATKNKEPGNDCPYIYTDDDIRHLVWSCEPEKPAKDARTAEEIAAEKAEKKRCRMIRKARDIVRSCAKEQLETADFSDRKYMQLALKRLERARTFYFLPDDFVDDFAATVGGLDTLPEEVAKCYREELEKAEEGE